MASICLEASINYQPRQSYYCLVKEESYAWFYPWTPLAAAISCRLNVNHSGTRTLEAVERLVKGPMFGCRMCGNCLLQETAFICPMECPKGVRNGPCGGSTEEHCYVDETRPCIWYKIYDRSFQDGA